MRDDQLLRGSTRGEDSALLLHARIRLAALFFAAATLIAGAAFGQATTGSIKGEVVDQADTPLAGVTVTLSSDAMQGTREMVTTEDGRFRFFALPPGSYRMEIAKEGFKTIIRPSLDVSLGRSVSLRSVMELPELGETVEVIDRRPLVDTESTGNSLNLNADFLKDLPSARSFQDVVQFLPGVTGGANPNINGGTAQQNRYYLDGASTTDPVLGTFSMNFNFDAIEDLEVITAGYDARYNQGLGGTINIVTKSGGNTFEGNFAGFFRTSAFEENGDRFVQLQRDTETRGNAYASLGGPIVKDRLWFFLAYQYTYAKLQPGTTAAIGRDYSRFPLAARTWQSHYILGKLTAQPFARNKFTLTVRGDPTEIENVNALAADAIYRVPEAESWWRQGGISATLSHELQIGGRAVLTTAGIYQYSSIKRTPMSWQDCEDTDLVGRCLDPELNVPARWAFTGSRGLDHGIGGVVDLDQRHNLQIKSDLEVGIDRLLGSHTLYAGVEVNPIWTDRHFGYTGNEIQLVDPVDADEDGIYSSDEVSDLESYENVARYIIINQESAETPGVLVNAYLQDRWTPVRGLTINLGGRFMFANLENNLGDTIIDTKALSWGGGIAWDPFRDGKTRISISGAQIADPGVLSLSSYINQQAFNSEYYQWDEAQQRWGENSTRAQTPASNITHPDMDVARTNEIFASVQREISRDLAAEVNFVYRRQTHPWEDDEVNVVWNHDGSDAVGFRNGSDTEVARLRTPEDAVRTYWSLGFVVRKQLSDNFQMIASYDYSRLVANTTGRIFEDNIDRVGRSQDFDNPTQRYVENGLAENDRPHVLKISATYDNPNVWKVTEKFSIGYALGGTINFQAGVPMNRKRYNLYQRGYTDYLELRGSGSRNPARLDLDLRGSLALKIAGTQVDIIVQVDNVLNSLQPTLSYEQALDADGEVPLRSDRSPLFATPSSTQAPRRVEIGARFTF